jgi:hypothetical protein
MQLHDPTEVSHQARGYGFTLESSRRMTLPSGKAFDVLTFNTEREA